MSRAHRSAQPALLSALLLLATLFTVTLLPPLVPSARCGSICPDWIDVFTNDVAVGDFDGDGLADMAVTAHDYNSIGHKIALIFGDAGPRPTRPGGVILTGVEWRGVSAGDLNGDGALDLIGANYDTKTIRVLWGDGHGQFQFAVPIPIDRGPLGTWVADFNGDSHLDVAVTHFPSDITVLFGDGAGGLGNAQALTADRPFGLIQGDVNGDGFSDLVAPTGDNSIPGAQRPLLVFLGSSNGTFTALPPQPTALNLGELAIGDMNEDGHLDVVATVIHLKAVVFLGHGDGTFETGPAAFTIPTGGGKLRLGDVDRDGHLDAVTVDLSSPVLPCQPNSLRFHRGGGDGTLAAGLITEALDTDALELADVNGDGFQDAVLAECGALLLHPGGPGGFETLVNAARAFTDNNNDVIRLNANKSTWCAYIEPVDDSFFPGSPTRIVLVSEGTGIRSTAVAISSTKAGVIGDGDDNQIQDRRVCFPKDQLRDLFSSIHGRQIVNVRIEGDVGLPGCRFSAPLSIEVIPGGGNQVASIRPLVFSAGSVLTFDTTADGPLRVRVFDVAGRMRRTLRVDRSAPAGSYSIAVDGRDDAGRSLASGVYLYRLESADGEATGRFVIAR